MRIITCLTGEHDLWLVAVAAVICISGSWVLLRLYRCACESVGAPRIGWLFLGAVAGGSTIWCTHFVAMLAYDPGAPVTYGPKLTAVSLMIAILATGGALLVASMSARRAPAIGGGVFGVGVAAMHYLGMAAFAVEGFIDWSVEYVAISVALAIGLGVAAFSCADHAASFRYTDKKKALRLKAGAAALLVLAICALHFTGMAAMTVLPLAPADGSYTSEMARDVLAISVASVGLLVVGTGAVSYMLDRESHALAQARLRHLTESAVDGMAVSHEGAVVEVNAALEHLTGRSRDELIGSMAEALFAGAGRPRDGELVKTELKNKAGERIPVEVVSRAEKTKPGAPSLVVYSVRDLRQRLAQERRITFLATSDSLTGLPNRAAFLDRLEGMTASSRPGDRIALLTIDLDKFKEINDLHGHAAGDHVLRSIAERMRGCLRDGENLARMGGDEFVALKPVANREDAQEFAERLSAQVVAPTSFAESDLRCGASIGVAIHPEDAADATSLINNADLAMYRAKETAGDAICFYDVSMDEAIRARSRIARELRQALAEDQFELHYQVQVDVEAETVSGYEALLRWRHPERGFVSPGEFIPIAENTGLILPIGEWVLRRACADAAKWSDGHKVAINLSGVQLGGDDLPELIADALMTSGLPAERLEVEVTETALIKDRERAATILRRVKALGVGVAIDDFGTGYSSLSMLQAFPFDKIKLDKSFLDELHHSEQSRAILNAVLSLGASLRIPVLAEGVETAEQSAFLRDQGCDLAQGYLYGRPSADAPSITRLKLSA